MANQTVTRVVESDLEPSKFHEILQNPRRIPEWASAFADSIEHLEGNHFRVIKDGSSFNLDLVVHQEAETVDYLRELPNGKKGGAYLRVIPRPFGGCTVVMTLPIPRNTTELTVGQDLEQELANLLALAAR